MVFFALRAWQAMAFLSGAIDRHGSFRQMNAAFLTGQQRGHAQLGVGRQYAEHGVSLGGPAVFGP